jgi:hypothetical protein
MKVPTANGRDSDAKRTGTVEDGNHSMIPFVELKVGPTSDSDESAWVAFVVYQTRQLL